MINHLYLVKLTLKPLLPHLFGNLPAIFCIRFLSQFRIRTDTGKTTFLGCFCYFTPYRIDNYILIGQSFRMIFIHNLHQKLDDIGIESTAKRTAGGENEQCNTLNRSLYVELSISVWRRNEERFQYMLEHCFVRKHVLYGILGMVQLTRCNHLHRTCYLTSALNTCHTSLDFL